MFAHAQDLAGGCSVRRLIFFFCFPQKESYLSVTEQTLHPKRSPSPNAAPIRPQTPIFHLVSLVTIGAPSQTHWGRLKVGENDLWTLLVWRFRVLFQVEAYSPSPPLAASSPSNKDAHNLNGASLYPLDFTPGVSLQSLVSEVPESTSSTWVIFSAGFKLW